MFKKFFSISVLACILVFCQTKAFAALSLELTQGMSSAVPIAIVPFKVTGNPSVNVSQVISDDLKNSGWFKLLDPSSMKQSPSSIAGVDFSYWKNQNINYLVVGEMKELGNGSYQLHVALVNVYQKNNPDPNAKSPGGSISPVVFDRTYVSKDGNLRYLAHNVADYIYEQILGIRGVFSTKIAYVLVQRHPGAPTKYSLEIADADGFNPRSILTSTDPIMSPSWSPNGKEIAYVSFENRRAAVYVSNIYTGGRQMISETDGINGAPAFSPDGKTLAIVVSSGDNTKIVLVDLASRKATALTDGSSIDTEPAFSPDGKSLAFTSDRGGTPQIYQMNLADRSIQRLTFSGNYNAKPSFVVDGTSIVMLHRDSDDFNIAIQTLSTSVVNVLTSSHDNQSPSIAPNGEMIIYAAEGGAGGILALVSVDGHVKLNLPETRGEVREPAWGPLLP